ncbi:MAG TPA: TIGR02678 family protein [Solirubrobacteraceae bacterium]|nr:TIGR02678 family protein [Solirubrobacteraceae bacterium]
MTGLRELDDREERTRALRALLAAPFVGADEPAYALVRRHERELASTLQVTYGYQLEIGSTAARASGLPTPDGLRRPLRITPASVSGRKRAPDEWAALSDRACVLVLLTLVALERGAAQTAIAELAQEVERAGADVEPPITVDFRQRSERMAFADGLDLLCAWTVIEHTSGSHESYSRREQGDDEALFTVDRRRLALLLRDPNAALEATTLDELVDESGRYSPTPEGENRARAERLARRLTDDPALLLADLDADDRTYFLNQRARIEAAVAAATGYEVERRAEGSALIVDDRAFTDLPFPTNSTLKQLALLLCDALAEAGPDGELSFEALRDAVADLVAKHRHHWDRNPHDPDEVAALTAAATDTLLACDLARRSGRTGGLRATPLAARFRSPTLHATGGRE